MNAIYLQNDQIEKFFLLIFQRSLDHLKKVVTFNKHLTNV